MEQINVSIGLDDDAIAKISSAVEESIVDSVKDQVEDSVKDYVLENIDINEDIQSWMDYNFSIEDHLRNIDFSEYYDMDIESEARSLLNNYSPVNACSTGEAFTDAVEAAVRYLLLKDEDFVGHIKTALDKFAMRSVIEDARAKIIEEEKPIIINEFRRELEQYFKDLEISKAKEVLMQTSDIADNNTIPNIGYSA